MLPAEQTTFLLGFLFLFPVSLIVHDFWTIDESNDLLRRAVVHDGDRVHGVQTDGPRQLPTFTSDFDIDFVPFIKNLQVASALYFYWRFSLQQS